MLDRIFRRRKANVVPPTSPVPPSKKHAVVCHTVKPLVQEETKRSDEVDEAQLSPSIFPPTTPTTSFTPDDLPVLSPEEETFRTNGEYYDQFLIRKKTQLPSRTCPASSAYSRRNPRDHCAPVPRNIVTLRGMPLLKQTAVMVNTLEVDPRSPLLPEQLSYATAVSSRVVGMMAPRPAPAVKKKELNKPKSLNLKSSAFRTLTKATRQGPLSSESTMTWGSKPSPSTSMVSKTANNTTKFRKSPLASAPELGSKWRSEYFKDLIPQLVGPHTSVPCRGNNLNKRSRRQLSAASRYKYRKRRLFTSGLRSMPDSHLSGATPSSAVMHISPPIMSNMSAEDPIPSAFLNSGSSRTSIASPRHSYYQSLPSGGSIVSNGSTTTTSSRLTQLVVKRNPHFDVPVSSGKSLLFS
ncbi:hypothetical protein V8F20_007319 [Naviculisporaceae sp. PSN 640]